MTSTEELLRIIKTVSQSFANNSDKQKIKENIIKLLNLDLRNSEPIRWRFFHLIMYAKEISEVFSLEEDKERMYRMLSNLIEEKENFQEEKEALKNQYKYYLSNANPQGFQKASMKSFYNERKPMNPWEENFSNNHKRNPWNADPNQKILASIKKRRERLLEFFNELYKYPNGIQYIFEKDKEKDPITKQREKYNLTPQDISEMKNDLKIKEIFLTCICICFPFYTASQKKQMLNHCDNLFTKGNLNFLEETLLLENNRLTKFLLSKKEKNKVSQELISDLSDMCITNTKGITKEYMFVVFCNILEEQGMIGDNEKVSITKIKFIIMVILKHYQYFGYISEDLGAFAKGLKVIKLFYESYFKEKPEEIFMNFDEEENFLSFKGISLFKFGEIESTFEGLFSKEDEEVYNKIFETLSHFYTFEKEKIIALVSKVSDIYFIFEVIELIYFKEKNIYRQPRRYKENLKKLEQEIFYKIKGNPMFNVDGKTIKSFSINKDVAKIFTSLRDFLKRKLGSKYIFDILPFGSITQLLSSSTSDLDAWINITGKKDLLIRFLEELDSEIRGIDSNRGLEISRRVLVFKIHYHFLKIDLSFIGFCPYLHGNLFRAFSIIDPRVSVLGICIKTIIEYLKIKNNENANERQYLNSFSWMVLLIVFLQDIISPPVLPKLLTNSQRKKKIVLMGGKNKLFTKNISCFFNCIEEAKIEVPINNYDNYVELYEIMKEKNTMTIGELLIKFLEFIGYFFKVDTIFADFSFIGEEFKNLDGIKRDEDEAFFNYFQKKYLSFKNKRENKIERDGMILIREPFDRNYNPAQTLKSRSYLTFIERIRKCYKFLVERGSINELKEVFNRRF